MLTVVAAMAVGCAATLAVQFAAGDDDGDPAARGVGFVELRGHVDFVDSATFSPDGSMVLTGSNDGSIKVWDAGSGTLLRTIGGGDGDVEAASFDRTSTRVLTIVDGDATVVDVDTGEEVVMDERQDVWSAVFGAGASSVVGIAFEDEFDLEGGAVVEWDISSGEPISMIDDGGYPEAVSPDGRLAVVSVADDEGSTVTTVWDVHRHEPLATLESVQEFVYYADAASFSDDGSLVARVTSEYTRDALDAATSVWDTATGDLVTTLDDATDEHIAVDFSHDGTMLVTTSFDDETFSPSALVLWDATSGERVRVLASEALGGVAFSPDDRFVAAATTGSEVTIWDTGTGREVQVLSGHIGAVAALDFSGDGSKIVTGSYDGTARIWDVG